MSTHGVDQDFAQRLTANATLRGGQRAIFFSSFISIAVGLLFLGVGALLWAYYKSHPMPADVPNPDHLFAHFIVTHFPVGVRGLMVAGVMAATMSTLDSVINALCATIYNDILHARKGRKLSTYFLWDNAVITLLLFTVAVAAAQNDGLLLLGLKIQSGTGGVLLALFATRILFPKRFNYEFTGPAVLGAYAFGIAGVALGLGGELENAADVFHRAAELTLEGVADDFSLLIDRGLAGDEDQIPDDHARAEGQMRGGRAGQQRVGNEGIRHGEKALAAQAMTFFKYSMLWRAMVGASGV
jgi:hypothetical protein